MSLHTGLHKTSRRSLLRCVMAMALLAWFPYLSSGQSRPLLQVEPTMNGPSGLRDSCLNPNQWPTGWARMDLFGNAVQYFGALNNSDLAQCVANVRNAGKDLVVAGWSLKEPGNCRSGLECWNALAPTFRRMRDLGAQIDYFEIDEPLTTGQPTTFGNAVEQTAEWIRLARSEFPGVKIILQEAYPYQSASTLVSFYTSVNSQAWARTGMGIQYAQVDHNWNAGGNAAGIKSIQDGVRGAGIGFSVIFWNASPTMSWHQGLMAQGEMYRNWRSAGVDPDLFAVINWTGSPALTVPEWIQPQSFASSVRNFANAFLPYPAGFGLSPGEQLNPGDVRWSADGRMHLTYQTDGNLVLYYGSSALWHAGTHGTSAGRAVMQSDGNLVVYDASNIPRWWSGTNGYNGAFCVIQGDGNLVIYHNRYPRWASNTGWY